METREFKQGLRELKNNLRNITLQIITANSVIPYSTLREFGNAILAEESKGNSFAISQAWTNEGVVIVTSLAQLAKLFVTKKVTGIQFRTFFAESNSAKYNLGSLD